jgi:flagellar motor protein MotB
MKSGKTKFRLISMPRVMMLLMVIMIAVGGTSCKSKKKIAAEKAAIELANQIAQAKASLKDLLRDDNPKTWQEKKDELDRIKAMQLRDPEVEDLINQVEAKLEKERQEILRKEEEAARLKAEQDAKQQKQAQLDNINSHFYAIASAPTAAEANIRIQRAISLYASKDVPVLIVVSKYGDNQKDYDRPTSIEKYLNYLKDIKKYDKQIESVKYDDFGKIIEIELIKK